MVVVCTASLGNASIMQGKFLQSITLYFSADSPQTLHKSEQNYTNLMVMATSDDIIKEGHPKNSFV